MPDAASTAQRLADWIDASIDLTGRLVSWVTLLLALVMGANVLMRYGFALGSIWMQELEWHLLVPICLIGMSYALRHGDHVRVDVLYGRFGPRARLGIDLLAAMLSMAFCVIVIWLSLAYVGQSWSIGEGTANPGGIEHRYVVKAIIPLGFALLFAQSLAQAIRALLELRRA